MRNRGNDAAFALLCGALIFCALYFGAVLGARGARGSASGEVSHSLRSGTTSFTLRIAKPRKAILYPEAIRVRTSYSVSCLKGQAESHNARTFTTGYTRNLLYGVPPRQDVCYLAVAAATGSDRGQIVIDYTSGQ
jgi:hypothetical protein